MRLNSIFSILTDIYRGILVMNVVRLLLTRSHLQLQHQHIEIKTDLGKLWFQLVNTHHGKCKHHKYKGVCITSYLIHAPGKGAFHSTSITHYGYVTCNKEAIFLFSESNFCF